VKAIDDRLKAIDDPLEAINNPVEAIADPLEAVNDPVKAIADPLEAIADALKAIADRVNRVERSRPHDRGPWSLPARCRVVAHRRGCGPPRCGAMAAGVEATRRRSTVRRRAHARGESTMTIRRVSPQEAKELIDQQGYVYVDVRSTGEFDQGHPTGSFNVPVAQPGPGGMAPNADFLAVMQANFPKDAKLVVACLAGGRSQRACAMLEQAGFTNLVDQRAGFGGAKDPFGRVVEPGWQAAGLPVVSGPDTERGYETLRKKKG
jgi:rhodanese-related sulfurtransferase